MLVCCVKKKFFLVSFFENDRLPFSLRVLSIIDLALSLR
jgi:hypothetical protein